MKRISEEQFQEWCGSHQIKGCGKRVTMCEIECRPIAQLESCEKELKAVIREIMPYIDHKEDCLIFRDNYHDALWKAVKGERVERECNCGIEALKQKWVK